MKKGHRFFIDQDHYEQYWQLWYTLNNLVLKFEWPEPAVLRLPRPDFQKKIMWE